jgi:hypothetical protein
MSACCSEEKQRTRSLDEVNNKPWVEEESTIFTKI